MNQRIGYARASTDDRNLDLQLDALRLAGVGSIYKEPATGRTAVRQELDHCLKALRAGGSLVVWRLDRLGRSLPDLVRIVAGLEEKGIGFESITEKIETNSAVGRLVFHVFAALAEFERNLIRERTRAGLVAARARGRVVEGVSRSWMHDALLAELGVSTEPAHANDITVLRHVRSSRSSVEKRAAEDVADRSPCKDFERFRPLFERTEQ